MCVLFSQDMTHVFEKAQESESKRLIFFKDMLFSTHKCLNISNDPRCDKLVVQSTKYTMFLLYRMNEKEVEIHDIQDLRMVLGTPNW